VEGANSLHQKLNGRPAEPGQLAVQFHLFEIGVEAVDD
jgi:hypothetical protein